MQDVTEREDSESYAKRTITEIETCLGFSFHGGATAEDAAAAAAAGGAPEGSISDNELEV